MVRVALAVWLIAGCGRIAFDPLAGSVAGGDASGDVLPQPAANVVFVTSTTQLPTMFDIAPYNGICQQRAQAGGLTGTFVAWLSSSTRASAQIAGARGFVRRDGLMIADQASEIAGSMRRPVAFDEFGAPLPSATTVMTGSDVTGDILGNCNGLSDDTGVIATGYADATLDLFADDHNVSCATAQRLYCFETDRSMPVSEPAQNGRRAFASVSYGTLGGGIAGADATCAADAMTAGLTGSFKALLATQTASAASRFSAAGANWVRSDGIPIAASPADFLAGRWIAPLDIRPGTTFIGAPAWFGADDPTMLGTAASTCSSWTVVDASSPVVGQSAAAGPLAFRDDAIAPVCNASALLYCVEE